MQLARAVLIVENACVLTHTVCKTATQSRQSGFRSGTDLPRTFHFSYCIRIAAFCDLLNATFQITIAIQFQLIAHPYL